MATILDNQAVRDAALPITVEQYHELSEAGIIAEKTELLRGVIVEKMTTPPQHTWMAQRLFVRGTCSLFAWRHDFAKGPAAGRTSC